MQALAITASGLVTALGSGEAATVAALRAGKSLAFGRIDINGADGRLAVQATTTYALL